MTRRPRAILAAIVATLLLTTSARAQKTKKEIAMEVFAIVNITSLLCPNVRLNKHAAAAMLQKAGVKRSDMLPDTPMAKRLERFAISVKDQFDKYNGQQVKLFCEGVISFYGPRGTVEPNLLDLR